MSFSGSWVPAGTGFPSRLVDPERSTTWIIPSASMMSERNWLPRPFPICAPGTRPAISLILTGMSLVPFTQRELFGLHLMSRALHGHWDLTYVTPTLGFMVVKTRFEISASTMVAALKKLVLPTFVLPATHISIRYH